MITTPLNLIPDSSDRLLIREIASRAAFIHRAKITLPDGRQAGSYIPILEWERDITICHLNAAPLNLSGLAGAPEAMFWSDVHTIRSYLDRQTGRMPASAALNFLAARGGR